MDFIGETVAGGNVLSGSDDVEMSGGFDNWGIPGSIDQGVWATEDDYNAWNPGSSVETPSNSGLDGRLSQNHSGGEPPNKRSRNSQGGDAHVIVPTRSKAIGKMFFKTKLCCKFRAGVCPYITNCNFAHGIEELRKPPPNWQEIVAAHESELGGGVVVEPPREEHQIPTMSSPDLRGETQRSYKGRHCKKFYTEEGCPYGDSCAFLHDEQSRARESVAISVTPTAGPGFGNSATAANQKPSNWKTRICNKWETTGYCPFGSKCHFAHGENIPDVRTNIPASLDCRHNKDDGNKATGIVPSEIELAEFAADVESLLGKGLDDESFNMEGLGLFSNFNKVKLETDEEAAIANNHNVAMKFDNCDDNSPVAMCDEEYDERGGEFATILQQSDDFDYKTEKKKILLKLDYEGVITAWADQRSPWTNGERPDLDSNDCWPDFTDGWGMIHNPYGEMGAMSVGHATIMDEGREARVSRYREKRRKRLFSKKIRYEVRKLNAEKRPRMKGRFVKRANFVAPLSFPLITK